MITTLKAMPYAQAKIVRFDDGTVVLRSYATNVIIVEPTGWLHVTGLYSATTIRHIGAFMKEMGYGDYFTAKACYKERYDFNVKTGEIRYI